MEKYLSELNEIAERVLESQGQHLDDLYEKIVEGKIRGYAFIKSEPSINHIKTEKLSDQSRVLFEHYSYLVHLKDSNPDKANFALNVEEDLKRTLRRIYLEQLDEPYFGKVEFLDAVYYVFTDSAIDFTVDKALTRHVEQLYYHHKVTAKNFCDAWLNFFNTVQIKNSWYENSRDWTERVIGTKCGNIKLNDSESFVAKVVASLDAKLCGYREDKFCDFSFYSQDKFEKVFSLQYDKADRKDILLEKNYVWSSQCLISFEHENHYLKAYEEMMYLTTRRARLKIVVTYFDDDPEHPANALIIFEALSENFSAIIRQSNLLFNENEQTEYLLILGSKSQEKRGDLIKINWHMQAFSWSGQWTYRQKAS